jgi:hypothetical protein
MTWETGCMFRRGSSKELVAAEGVILESTPSTLYRRKCWLVVGVRFDDGETVEFTQEITDFYVPHAKGPGGWLKEMGGEGVVPLQINVGERVPVHYAANDRTKLSIDEPSLQQQAMSRHEQDLKARRAQAEAALAQPGVSSTRTEPGNIGSRSAQSTRDDRDSLDYLELLANLHDRGVLSDGEFETEKSKILRER